MSSQKQSDGNDRLTSNTTYYLEQLLWDKYVIDCMPNVFTCVDNLINDEIRKVKATLMNLPEDEVPEAEAYRGNPGPVVILSEKLFVPVKEYPNFNFVGRILGPRGMTAKQLEQKTGCKIMVRGKGSMRDKHKEEQNRGKPNWEHLNEDLHVLITVEDCKEMAETKLERAKKEISRLLVPLNDGEDELKRFQLMELAILNGTYRNDNYDLYQKSKGFDSNAIGRPLMHNPIPAGLFFPQCMQAQSPSNKESPESAKSPSPIGVMGYPYQSPYSQYFSTSPEMAGLVYVDPYTPLGGSAYFGGQTYSETTKAEADCSQ